jgi:diguanylate cyclase
MRRAHRPQGDSVRLCNFLRQLTGIEAEPLSSADLALLPQLLLFGQKTTCPWHQNHPLSYCFGSENTFLCRAAFNLIGDQVLRLVAAAIKNRMSSEDIAARFGGDEFAMVLGGKRGEEARALADEICRTISGKELVKRSTGESLGRVTVSIGVAAWQAGENGQALLERADTCLGSAKRDGRNCVVSDPGAMPEARVA